jgi:hypothetical protein
MFGPHFYHAQVRKIITVFGTLFNNITVVKTSNSNAISTIKVPLSYGPRQKFLARIKDEKYLDDPKLAVALPRMTFEITSIMYDSGTKLQKGIRVPLKRSSEAQPKSSSTILYPVPYKMGIQLSILANFSDDALQILEQILPFFQPDYTVTINEIDNQFKTDIPFVIQSVSMMDDYEGDFNNRRTITYTLDFETRLRFYGNIREGKLIKETKTTISDIDMLEEGMPYSMTEFKVFPKDAEETDEYEIKMNFDTFVPPKTKIYSTINIDFEKLFPIRSRVRGLTSAAEGMVSGIRSDHILIDAPDEKFLVGEEILSLRSNEKFLTNKVSHVWNHLGV